MAVDLGVFQRQVSLLDRQRLQQEFEAKKALQQAQIVNALATGGNQAPSAVKEFKYFESLDPQRQQEYLNVKRSSQVLNLGNQMAIRGPGGGIVETYDTAPTPDQQFKIDSGVREQQDQYNRGLQMQKKALEAVQRLKKNTVGVERVSGLSGQLIPLNMTQPAMDAAADLEYTKNLLTTENLGLLKGVLSDTDMKVLASLGSGELSGSDERVKSALVKMEKALSGKVSALEAGQTQEGLPPLPSAVTAKPTTQGFVRVQDVDGKNYDIPASDLDAALKSGAKRI